MSASAVASAATAPYQVVQFIDGVHHRGTDNDSFFRTINPATNTVIANVQQASMADVDAAVISAQAGFLKWSAMSAKERSVILFRAAALLKERNVELAELEVEDTGKPISEANCVDILSGADAIEYFAGLVLSMQGTQQQLTADQWFYTRREPLGVCAGIGAWNYPIQIACWKSAVALATGNAMIFKPSEETPLSVMKLAEIYIEAGVPKGVFNVVQGNGAVGMMLSRHPAIAKVSFTGEVGTGRKVMADAAGSLKSVTMELGGKSPLLIFDDVNLESAVHGAMLANFYTQGEVCTNGTRVYVQRSIYEPFMALLKEKTKKMVVGNPMNPGTHVGALISKRHLEKVCGYFEQGIAEGAELLCGGRRFVPKETDMSAEDYAGCKDGNFVLPTVFGHCNETMSIVKDEIFGPLMSVLVFDTEVEVIARANDTHFGLAAGVFTESLSRAHRVVHQLQAGICWINAWGNSPSEMPVGGYKASGIGRENGPETLMHYTQTKSVFVSMTPIDNVFC